MSNRAENDNVQTGWAGPEELAAPEPEPAPAPEAEPSEPDSEFTVEEAPKKLGRAAQARMSLALRLGRLRKKKKGKDAEVESAAESEATAELEGSNDSAGVEPEKEPGRIRRMFRRKKTRASQSDNETVKVPITKTQLDVLLTKLNNAAKVTPATERAIRLLENLDEPAPEVSPTLDEGKSAKTEGDEAEGDGGQTEAQRKTQTLLDWFPQPVNNIRGLLKNPEAVRRFDAWAEPADKRYGEFALNTFANEEFRDGLEEFTNKIEALNKFVAPAVSTLQMRDWGKGRLESVTRAGTITSAAFSVTKIAADMASKYSERIEEKYDEEDEEEEEYRPAPSMYIPGCPRIGSDLADMFGFVLANNWDKARHMTSLLKYEDAASKIENAFVIRLPEVEGEIYLAFQKFGSITFRDEDGDPIEDRKSKWAVKGIDRPPTTIETIRDGKVCLKLDDPQTVNDPTIRYPWLTGKDYVAVRRGIQRAYWRTLEEQGYHTRVTSPADALKPPRTSPELDAPYARLEETDLTRILMNKWEALKRMADSGNLEDSIGTVLLYAPPGLGKTLGAEQIAWRVGRSFTTPCRALFDVSYEYLQPVPNVDFSADQYQEDVIELIRKAGPQILVLDELDGVLEMGNVRAWMEQFSRMRRDLIGPCLIMVTTNSPHRMNTALLRAGRMDELLEVTPEMVGNARAPALRLLDLSEDQLKLVQAWPIAYLNELRRRVVLYGNNPRDVRAYIHELDARQREADHDYAMARKWGHKFRLPEPTENAPEPDADE